MTKKPMPPMVTVVARVAMAISNPGNLLMYRYTYRYMSEAKEAKALYDRERLRARLMTSAAIVMSIIAISVISFRF